MSEPDEISNPVRTERRLAAILAADVVGYGALMQQDEEGTHERLRALLRDVFRPSIERHRGRIVKTTGDGLLVEFASLIDSVRCAVVLQQAIADGAASSGANPLRFRMGINLGDILIEEGDVFGDGVNLAARLESLADAGGVLVSAAVYDQVGGRVPFRFEDMGERAGKGFERPIRSYSIRWEDTQAESAKPAALALPKDDKPSIAILPFTNMSSNPEQEFFADGLSEDLITDLSKVPGLMVIARNSSFVFKGKAVDIRTVARDLGVRYVVEGSVRRASGRVRINAQLIDATDNSHLWADRFDGEVADVFALQDDVVRKIVGALSSALPSVEPLPKRRAPDLAAYELFVRARPLVTWSQKENRVAEPMLERAVEVDPDFADAHAWLAMCYHFGWLHWGQESNHTKALASALHALSLDPQNVAGHMTLGYLRVYEGNLAEGVTEFETALRLNPNNADAWAFFADVKVFEGKPEEAIGCVRTAFRLNPFPPSQYFWLLAWAEYAAKRYEAAVATLRSKSAELAGPRRVLAASLAQLGRLKEAQEEGRIFLAENPHFSMREWADTQPFKNAADLRHFMDGYAKAGLPM